MSEFVNRDFLNIVKAALWNEAMPEVEMSEELIRLIMRQGVGPLVFPALLEKPLSGSPLKGGELGLLKAVCVQNMQTQAKMQIVLEQAWKALEKAGIKAVLMKGAGLAALYPDPSMRQWGDIDLFVGKEQYHPACAVMRETFPKALKFDEELDHYKHYNIIADGVSIETHRVSVSLTHPRDVRRYAEMERYGMANSEGLVVSGLEVRVPEPTFNALMVFLHAWEHLMTKGANIRQLCDLALLLHHKREAIDWKRLEQWLKALKAWDVWQVYMWILVEYLGLENEGMRELESEGMRELENERMSELAIRGERLLETMLGERMRELGNERVSELGNERVSELGNERVSGKTYKNRFVRKWHTMKVRIANAEWLAQFSPAYARHQKAAIWLSGLSRLFAKDRHWE